MKLKNALDQDVKLVQFRLKDDSRSIDEVSSMLQKTSALCAQAKAKLLLNIPQDHLRSIDLSKIEFDGYHADSRMLNKLSLRPDGKLFSASCHNLDELQKAEQLAADFAVLSPVQKTASHPEMAPLGWQQFSDLTGRCTMPVYALGGVTVEDMEYAWSHGAQGIAAISALWYK